MHDLGQCMEAVARELLGEPNAALSKSAELRYGARGSLSVDLEKGTWYDHEKGEGGGVLDLIVRKTGLANGAAIEWLRDRGIDVGSEARPQKTQRFEDRIERVYRYERADGTHAYDTVRLCDPKDFRQRASDGSWSIKGLPRVLYRLRRLLEAPEGALVFVAEGEKDVDRLSSLGLIATTNVGGAGRWRDQYADALRHSRVVAIPDNDEAGARHAADIVESCRKQGIPAAVLRLDGLPQKGDVSDWLDAGGTPDRLLALAEAALKAPQDEPASDEDRKALRFRLTDWTARRYEGEPPPVEWLIEGVLPLGVPGMLAAMGGTGKSYTLQELALAIAAGTDREPVPILGGKVVVAGTAVIITAEDDAREIHRRQAMLGGLAPENAHRLIIVALPDAGGPLPLFCQTHAGLHTTKAWDALTAELRGLRDLRLVVLDPLQAFASGINEDPAAGQFVCGQLGQLAAETGATVLVAHHMRKSKDAITTLTEAREAIRGTTALVDGVRWAFAFWPVEESTARSICREIGRDYTPNAIVQGGVVKANGEARREVRTYSRRPEGLLRDVTVPAGRAVEAAELLDAMVSEISRAAKAGVPFTHTGQAGVYQQRERLPASLRALSRHRLEALVQAALDDRRVMKCVGPNSTVPKYLDVPEGPFARGDAEVIKGAAA